jgi:murein DD-endopeptidase MepM/ murein hydrolase activator NlpD
MRSRFVHVLLPGFAIAGVLVALSAAEPKLVPAEAAAPAALVLEVAELPAVAAPPPVLLDARLPEPPPEILDVEPEPEPAPGIPVAKTIEGQLGEQTTLSSALTRQGATRQHVATIAGAMAGHFDFRLARPQHSFRLALDSEGEILEFRYRTSEMSSYRMARDGDGFTVRREEAELLPRTARIAGVVSSTLYRAVIDLGEQGQLARDFADVFAWDIDFQRSVQPGDTFHVLYERLFRSEKDGTETYMRPGRILAAEYEGTAGLHRAVYFEPEEGRGGYYRPDGTSVQGQFLMAPLRHARVTSAYSAARRHPILKVVRPHHGIDYAAPHGTPVWAVADGEVIYRARAGGFGNLVKIRHSNGYVSYYAHLSRFMKRLKVGDRVEQKQVVGYVGATGLATGPHVCFRVAQNGHYVNPARIKMPAGDPIPSELLPTFESATAMLLAELSGETQLAKVKGSP